jgi:hypothetical protein
MSIFNFKKEARLYIVHNNLQYNIDISDISFSQTFTEDSYSVKTLHNQNMFEASSITKANPANFSFTMPILKEPDLSVQLVLDRLIDYDTVDLYISTEESVFKVENAVFTTGSFAFEKSKVLNIAISGEASKLLKVETAIPGIVQVRASPQTYLQMTGQTVKIGGVDISSCIYKLSVELQNDIDWNSYTTVHDGIQVTNAGNSMYPTKFTVDKRILAGNIGQYLTDSNSANLQNWNKNISLRIEVGQNIDGTLCGFDFNIPTCSFTNRVSVASVFTQEFDWRLTDNLTALSSIIRLITKL